MNPFRLTQDARENWRRQNLGVRPDPQGGLKKVSFTQPFQCELESRKMASSTNQDTVRGCDIHFRLF